MLRSMRNGSSQRINEAMQIYTMFGGSDSYYCLLCASVFHRYAQYFLSSAFQYKTPLKRPSIFLFGVFFFISCSDIFPPPPCTHSKLPYEVLFLIKICSGNFTRNPSRCTTASVTEVWEPGELSSAEVVMKHKQGNFEPSTTSLSPKFFTALRTEKQMPLL